MALPESADASKGWLQLFAIVAMFHVVNRVLCLGPPLGVHGRLDAFAKLLPTGCLDLALAGTSYKTIRHQRNPLRDSRRGGSENLRLEQLRTFLAKASAGFFDV